MYCNTFRRRQLYDRKKLIVVGNGFKEMEFNIMTMRDKKQPRA